jgi:hypothetical protein
MILDNAETTSKKDSKNFSEIIETLLEKCPNLRFLFTSRDSIDNFGTFSLQIIELKELHMKHAVELLKRKSPRPIEEIEIQELLKVKPNIPNKMLGTNPREE